MNHHKLTRGNLTWKLSPLALGIFLVVAAFVVNGIGLGGEEVARTLPGILFVVGAVLVIPGLVLLVLPLAQGALTREPVTIETVLADLARLHESERRRVVKILAGDGPFREVFLSRSKRFEDRVQQSLDRVADGIRDSLLDWNPDADDGPDRPRPGPLPALAPARLVEEMRPKMEASLEEVARALNESPDPADLEARCEELHRLFTRLLCVALQRGEDLRVDAAVQSRPVPGSPHGWAEGFRRIKADEARQTDSPSPR